MSIRLMSIVWEIQFPTQSQLLAALKLADFANDDGSSIYPSRNRLANHCQCSETTIKVVLRAFREAGLLIVVREGGSGPRDTTEYRFDVGMLRALADGECMIKGDSESIEIVEEVVDEAGDNSTIPWINKGAESAPLDGLRGRPGEIRGRPGPNKGAASRPQPFITRTINIESPSRERAGAHGHAPAPARPAIRITEGDVSWHAWLEAIARRLGEAARKEALQVGCLTVCARWPHPDVPLPIIASVSPGALTETSRRITGEGSP